MIKLTADECREALVSWVKDEISSPTTVRFEMAKFFTTSSSAALGFTVAAWKAFHKGEPTAGWIMWGLGILAVSAVFAMYMFWPVLIKLEPDTDIGKLHNDFVRRLTVEGLIWGIIWSTGLVLGISAILH